MWTRVRLWWEARTCDAELSDDDLERATRRASKAIVQTLSNRAFRRPELSAADPYGTAVEQRAFDRETVGTYRENIVPEIEPVRAGYLARGAWTPDLEAVYRDPGGVEDLRELAVGLEELAAEL